MNPNAILAIVGATLALTVGAFFYGKHVEAVERDAAEKTLIEKAIESHDEQAKIDYQALLKVELAKQKAKDSEVKRNAEITKELQTNQDVYTNPICNLPATGLRIWNSAGSAETATSESDGQVPR